MAGPPPRFHFVNTKDDFYTCLRYRWFEAKRNARPQDIHNLLNEVRRFPGLQSLILEGCARTMFRTL
jgi:hypothetical protein